jgi:hypothetical protein
VLVGPYLNSHRDIEHYLWCDSSVTGCFETSPDSPSGDALWRTRLYYSDDQDPAMDRFVVLITDGNPSCTNDPSECEDAGRQAAKLFTNGGIKTIVLGIGDEAKNSTCLDAVALMGQTRGPNPGDYPWVGDPAQLESVLQKAFATVEERACRFTYPADLADRERLRITVNFEPLPRDLDHKDGWDFDPTGIPQIQLFGPACKKLKCSQITHGTVKATVSCTQCGSTSSCP